MVRAEIKAQAKEQLKGNVGKYFLCMLIIFEISFVCGLIPGIGSIASIIITPSLTIGVILFCLDLSYGKSAEVGRIFHGFQYCGKALWLTILVAVFTFLWALLLYIPGIIKGISYSMSYYILAENPEMTAREALNESKAIMHGHKMEYFVLQLSFIPWILLCTITLGIAMIYVQPYMQLTTTNFYHKIKRQPQPEVEVEVETVVE